MSRSGHGEARPIGALTPETARLVKASAKSEGQVDPAVEILLDGVISGIPKRDIVTEVGSVTYSDARSRVVARAAYLGVSLT